MQRRAGFTLIEVVIVLVILGVTAGALLGIIGTLISSWEGTSKQAGRDQDARAALGRVAYDVRAMNPEVDPANLRQTSFTYMDDQGNTITLSWSGTPGDPLVRTVGSGCVPRCPSTVLIEDVQDLQFTYELE